MPETAAAPAASGAPALQEIVVAGAGPVGVTAALTLAQQGFDVTVLESLSVPSSEWRASTFHPPTLDVARELQVSDAMLEKGLISRSYQVRDRTVGVIAEFDYGVLDGETNFPFRLQLEQYKYTQIVTEALEQLPNVRVLRGRAVREVAQSGKRVTVTADAGAGTEIFGADFLVAADGAHSDTRHRLGIRLEGETYEHRYLVLSIDAPLEELVPGVCAVNYVADPHEHLLLLRIPDLWRVILSVPPHISDEEALSRRYVSDRLLLLTSRDLHDQVRARQIYSVHQRVAERFLVDRIALVGDAAHINSPMGGMGLNSGIHDAFDLALTLTKVRDGADLGELQSWAERRRRVALDEIRRITHDNTSKLAEKGQEARSSWQQEMVRVAKDPARAKQWLLEASMIDSVRRHGGLPLTVQASPPDWWRRFDMTEHHYGTTVPTHKERS